MTSLSQEALMVSAVAVMREMTDLEAEIAEMGRDHPDVAGLGDDLVQLTRVLGELRSAYLASASGPDGPYPPWDSLRKQAGRD